LFIYDFGFFTSFGIKRQTLLGRNSFGYSSGSDVRFRGENIPFFIKPNLRIDLKETHELKDLRWRLTLGEFPKRKFVNFIVENEGREPARNCQVRLRVLEKMNNCQTLSKNDTKSLLWENDKTKIDIPAKYGSASFYLVFSQEQPLQINNSIYCGVVNEKINKFYSWISTNKHYRLLDLGYKTSCVKVNLEFM
jgi:hypothetical protein